MAERKPLFMATEGYSEEMAVTDSITLGGLTVGASGINMATHLINNLGDPLVAQDAATKNYVDLVAQGLDPKPNVRAVETVASVTLTGLARVVDGYTLTGTGWRVLLTAQSSGTENGIWAVGPTAWSRPADFAVGYHATAVYTFAQAGTNWKDTGWICTNAPGSDVVGTDALTWMEFSGAGQVVAGAGLTKSGNTISVKSGDGIEVSSNSASTNVALGATPGLTLSGTAGSKLLNALVSATGGVQIDGANGLALLLNGTTLQTGVTGVSVKGVPLNFEVNGTATHGASAGTGQVTAANLDILTAGPLSNADALHTHEAMESDSALKIKLPATAGATLAKGVPVYMSGNGTMDLADASVDVKARVVGLTLDGVTGGSVGYFINDGLVPSVLTGATFGVPYYLQNGGGIGVARPGAGYRVIMMGYAYNATDLLVDIKDYGKQAA